MKKVLFIAVLGLIAFSSCKKEKDCECTSTITGMPIASTPVVTSVKIEDKECSDLNTTTTAGILTTKMECKEK